MGILIGTDEAGYGPSLGPLIVSATVWQIPDGMAEPDLSSSLSSVFTSARVSGKPSLPIRIADSKQLYRPGGGLQELEQGVLVLLATCGKKVDTWLDLWSTLDEVGANQLAKLPWYANYDHPLPVDCMAESLHSAAAEIERHPISSSIRCLHVRSTAIFPRRLNELIEEHGNKASALSDVTLALVRSLTREYPDERTLIRCDKHGGRNKYAALLQHFFPENFVRVHHESRAASHYSWISQRRAVDIQFITKGDTQLACAAASMASKYLRELAMRAFNRFWRQHLPHLRPTAGYPVDARRFKTEIQEKQRSLGIDDRVLWRNR